MHLACAFCCLQTHVTLYPKRALLTVLYGAILLKNTKHASGVVAICLIQRHPAYGHTCVNQAQRMCTGPVAHFVLWLHQTNVTQAWKLQPANRTNHTAL